MEPSGASPSPAMAEYPRWVLLENREDSKDPDATTVAAARTSAGHPIRVAFRFAAPPAMSRVRVDCPGIPGRPARITEIYASHRDSVLLEITSTYNGRNGGTDDLFVYRAGDASAVPPRPPSLSLLPPCYLKQQVDIDQEEEEDKEETYPRQRDEHEQRCIEPRSIGILRLADGELVLAHLAVRTCRYRYDYDHPTDGELCVFRSGEWDAKRKLPILYVESNRKELYFWDTDMVIPLGDRFLYWVDLLRGIIFTDLSENNPELWYLSLPVKPSKFGRSDDEIRPENYRRVTVTVDGTVRFVDVFPRCCCGSPGHTRCARSRNAFAIATWTLWMDNDGDGGMAWTKDCTVDCDELWALPGYDQRIPRVTPTFPIMSMDDLDVVCFTVCDYRYCMDVNDKYMTWLIKVDVRRKELRLVTWDNIYYYSVLPSDVSMYFNISQDSSNNEAARIDDASSTNSAMDYSLETCSPEMASPEEMLETLREIPDLARDDLLRAYGILTCDDSQLKFRSLLALPLDCRMKHCLMMKHGNM